MRSSELDIIHIYLRASWDTNQFIEHLASLEEKGLFSRRRNTIIGGDFNICFLRDHDKALIQYLESKGFTQMIKKATHIDGNLIDHIYTNIKQIEVEQASKYYSDHDALCVTYSR
jgi:endonuclease/exonuclease/phosphatase (EEP) superfamily protein YafD